MGVAESEHARMVSQEPPALLKQKRMELQRALPVAQHRQLEQLDRMEWSPQRWPCQWEYPPHRYQRRR